MKGKKKLLVFGMVICLVLGFSILTYGLSAQITPLDKYESLRGGDASGAGALDLDYDDHSAPSADYVNLPDYLLAELNNAQEENGSWEGDLNTTAISSYVNTYYSDYATDYANDSYVGEIAEEGLNWTSENYLAGAPEAQAFIIRSVPLPEYDSFHDAVMDDLLSSQQENGSWNDDVSDTALATYALANVHGSGNESVQKGIDWIIIKEINYEWDSVQNDAKAILALDITGYSIDNERENLRSKQEPDGSFGTVEDTAWALMALSLDLDLDNLEYADKAIVWLRAQDIEDEYELAIAALGEQYYNSAVIDSDMLAKRLGPPFWLYPAIIVIIGAFLVLALLFARLGSEDVMGGVRKEIYNYIAENPGEHLAEITRQFDMSSSSARHHLAVLEWNDKIISHKQGKHRHYYLNMNGYRQYTNGFEYKEIMSTLKNDTTREIVKYLTENNNSNQKSISEALNIHPSTVNWHAKRLKDAKIIAQTRSGKDILYSLNHEIDIERVISLTEGASS